MDLIKKSSFMPLVSESLFLLLLVYNKLKKNYNKSFNSFHLLTSTIGSLIFFHLIYLVPFLSSNNFYFMIVLIILFFSYIIRIKRISDCLSLSKIFKSLKIKNKSEIIYKKFNYSFELLYFIIFIILSTSIITFCFYLKKIKIEKYTLLTLSIIILLFFCFKIWTSDLKKRFKKNYIIEIVLYLLLFSNLTVLESSPDQDNNNTIFYQYIFIFISEFLFIISLCVNCGLLKKVKITEEKLLISKKIKSDFYLFFNNELCFYTFTSYLNENESDSIVLIKLYIEINKYKIKIALKENIDDAKNIIDFYNNNKQNIKNSKIKDNIDKIIESRQEIINNGKYEDGIFDELFKIVSDYLNKEFESFKKTRDYEKLFSFLDLVYFLDENIFVESFYYDYSENEQLQSV